MAETPRRSFRVPGDRYEKAQKAAETLGTDLTKVVNDSLDKLITKASRTAKEPVAAGE